MEISKQGFTSLHIIQLMFRFLVTSQKSQTGVDRGGSAEKEEEEEEDKAGV